MESLQKFDGQSNKLHFFWTKDPGKLKILQELDSQTNKADFFWAIDPGKVESLQKFDSQANKVDFFWTVDTGKVEGLQIFDGQTIKVEHQTNPEEWYHELVSAKIVLVLPFSNSCESQSRDCIF